MGYELWAIGASAAVTVAPPRHWAVMTASELGAAAEARDVVLLPIGAVEQHGPHLPVDTDISGARATAEAIAERVPSAIVAPPVWWGLSAAHEGFPGLLSLSTSTFLNLLEDLCGSIARQGFDRIVLVVAHATNKPVVGLVVEWLMRTHGVAAMQLNYLGLGREAFLASRSTPTGDSHAGELETAVQLHLRPRLVHMDRAPSRPIRPAEHFGHSAAPRDMFDRGSVAMGFSLRDAFPEGVMGDASAATPETGRRVWEQIVGRACELVAEYGGGS